MMFKFIWKKHCLNLNTSYNGKSKSFFTLKLMKLYNNKQHCADIRSLHVYIGTIYYKLYNTFLLIYVNCHLF